jgi:hypothetical protein
MEMIGHPAVGVDPGAVLPQQPTHDRVEGGVVSRTMEERVTVPTAQGDVMDGSTQAQSGGWRWTHAAMLAAATPAGQLA